jgi:hypothetical protein
VAGAEHARRHPLLDDRRQVQQPQGVADVRPGTAYLARQLLVGGAEIVEELLVRGSLFERVELLAVQVLDQGVSEELVVLSLLDDRTDLGQPGALAGPPPPLTHDELVPTGPGRADDHRLEQADFADRLRELLKGLFVEGPPRLPGIRRDRGDLDLPVVSAQDLYRHVSGISGSGRLRGGVRTAGGITVGQARRFLDERAESPA